MTTRWLSMFCAVALAACASAGESGRPTSRPASAPASAATACPAVGDEAIVKILKLVRQKYDLPAMAGAIVTSKGLVAAGAVGVRKRGTDVAVGLEDQWHLGSDTKVMTALLAGLLVERGQLDWDAKIATLLPDLAPSFHPDFAGITLREVLNHRAGLPSKLPQRTSSPSESIQSQRLQAVKQILSAEPAYPPGSKFLYSNQDYVLAGAILEHITGKPWEQVIREGIFDPLGMKSAGFGGVGTPGQIDQPWPHRANGQPMPRNGPNVDNPPLIGPAGRVHCSIQDWAKFIADQLRGLRGEPALAKPSTYEALATSPGETGYGFGWIVAKRDWAGGKALNHAGSNTMNFCVAWLAPERDFAVLVCVNQGGGDVPKAADQAVAALIKLHNAQSTETR
ncbi:MAG: serine hydrolase [Candidatus Sumerlaeota bacterium]|nr:serine hydrolase [Candidatus Sumerlaeota bacterium]